MVGITRLVPDLADVAVAQRNDGGVRSCGPRDECSRGDKARPRPNLEERPAVGFRGHAATVRGFASRHAIPGG